MAGQVPPPAPAWPLDFDAVSLMRGTDWPRLPDNWAGSSGSRHGRVFAPEVQLTDTLSNSQRSMSVLSPPAHTLSLMATSVTQGNLHTANISQADS